MDPFIASFLFAAAVTALAGGVGFFSRRQVPLAPPVFLEASEVFILFLIFFSVQVVLLPASLVFVTEIARFVLGRQDISLHNISKGWVTVLSAFAALGGELLYLHHIGWKRSMYLWQGEEQGFIRTIKEWVFGIVAWFVSYPVLFFTGLSTTWLIERFIGTPTEEQTAVVQVESAIGDPVLFAFTFIAVGIAVPIAEELLFRGFLQTWLKRWLRFPLATLLTSIIFASMHFSPAQGLANLQIFFPLFVLSCYLGIVFEVRRNLWAAIGLHSFFNCVSMLSLYFRSTQY